VRSILLVCGYFADVKQIEHAIRYICYVRSFDFRVSSGLQREITRSNLILMINDWRSTITADTDIVV